MPHRHPHLVPLPGGPQVDAALAQRASMMQANAERRKKVSWRARLSARAQSAVALSGFLGTLPLSTALPALAERHAPAFPDIGPDAACAIVMGVHMTKGLHLCRHLRAAGMRVIAVESDSWKHAAARWSRAIERFVTVPNPDVEPHRYVDAVVALVETYNPRVVITSATPGTAIVDALVAERLHSSTHHWSLPPQWTALLDNKLTFSQTCQRLGLAVPDFQSITSKQQLFAINARLPGNEGASLRVKSVAYDPVARLHDFVLPMHHVALEKLTRDFEISTERPWIAQASMQGEEYSTYALAYRGRLVAYADTRACASNLRYQPVHSEEMEAWVAKLCAALQLDGQICVDFMRDKPGGRLMAIECNPRASTVLTCFHDQPSFAQALCHPETVKQTVRPKAQPREQYWLYHELFMGLRTGDFETLAQLLREGSDALLDPRDPWPFLGMHAAQIPTLLARRCQDGIPWTKIDLNIGKLAEWGGE